MIEIYSFDYAIDGQLFSGRISAKSREHAESLVPFAFNVDPLVGECDLYDDDFCMPFLDLPIL